MSCKSQVLGGLPQNCEQNVGGVKKVYIANRSDVTAVAVDETSHMIKTITMDTSKKFKSYGFKKGAASFASTATIDNANGVYFVQTVVSIDFAKMETRKRIEMSALSLGELIVIVLDANNKYWLLGQDEYAYATAGTGETGAARTDSNHYHIEITDESSDYPYEVDPTAIADIVEETAE